ASSRSMKMGRACTLETTSTSRQLHQTLVPSRRVHTKRDVMKVDHHIHTSRHSPDSSIDPVELLAHAVAIGLDAVVITEHDYQWSADELADVAAREPLLRVFSGAEISAREGHFLVYGLPSLGDAPPGIFLRDLIEVVRSHQAAIVAAHPFRWDQ